MFSIRSAARWVGRHSLPAAAVTVVVVGAAGGGVGYAIAGQHTAAAVTTAPSKPAAPAGHPAPARGGAQARGQALVQRALSMLAKETGQSVASIRTQLASGKSIDDIAGAKAPAIENQILAQLTKLGDRAKAAGRITAAQETTYLAMAKTKVEALMAEPGTQLMKDVRSLLQMLRNHAGAAGLLHPTPSPGA